MGLGYSGYDVFGVFDIMFFIIFLFVIGVFIAVVVKGVSTWNKNNNSPRLTVAAKVVSKRTKVSHHNHANAGDVTGAHGYSTTSSTWHYVTFQVESEDRMELSVTGSEFGMLAEGDVGKLSFQGTRFLFFERSH